MQVSQPGHCFANLPGFAQAAEVPEVQIPGKAGMIVRSARFLDLEMPPEFFNSWITPVPHFFVRNHMHEPSTLDPDSWRLVIGGEVDKPLNLSLADLGRWSPQLSLTHWNARATVAAFNNLKFPGCSGSAARWGRHASAVRACMICCSVPGKADRQACNVSRSR